ncbi:MAG: RNA polymerase sigma factor [Chthonomonadales bacterium]
MSCERTAAKDADGDLVSRFLAGDRSAFDALFQRHQDYVYRIALGIVGDAEDAQDVAQNAFLQAYRSMGSFRRGARFATWLYRITVNCAVDALRAAKARRAVRLDHVAPVLSDTSDGPEAVAQRNAQDLVVRCALAAIPVRYRDALVLRYYGDLSLEEIAEVLGCSVAAAKVRLHRARLAFKERFEHLGFGEEDGD